MSVELKIPDVGESIQEAQIGKWLKQEGDKVEVDEDVVELETDKASMELPAPASGKLAQILKHEGDSVAVGDVIAHIEESEVEPTSDESSENSPSDEAEEPRESDERSQSAADCDDNATDDGGRSDESTEDQSSHAKDERTTESTSTRDAKESEKDESDQRSFPASPSARRALRKHGLSADEVEPAEERLRPEDVERHVRETAEPEENAQHADQSDTKQSSGETAESEWEEVVPMSLIRRRIAERLVEAQQSAALLTTFNEIDMSAVIELRDEFRERFEQEHGIDLGYMSFFVKAVVDALSHFLELNAEVRGDNIAYRRYYHIGIAVGGEKGLVVPVLRYCERLSFAEIEEAIEDFARRAESRKLEPEELTGGTFTITNGGVYGSLLSTPIVNPPQSGVLGMHAIQDRPVARGGQIVIRPMMYVALTYDHRIVDGQLAVSFLKRVKQAIEEPARMLIEV